jgi:hypothetical protein
MEDSGEGVGLLSLPMPLSFAFGESHPCKLLGG